MSNIAFIPLLFTQVSFSRLPKSYRKLILFPYCLYRCFFLLCLSILYSARLFSTAILLSPQEIFKFTGNTNSMASKSDSHLLKKIFFICFSDSSSTMMNNAFYFIFQLFSFSKYLNFCLDFLGM